LREPLNKVCHLCVQGTGCCFRSRSVRGAAKAALVWEGRVFQSSDLVHRWA